MPTFDTQLELLALLMTFAIHSTLLLSGAWLLSRSLGSPRLRELVWKGALVGALLTAALQTQVASGPLTIHFGQAGERTALSTSHTPETDSPTSVIGLDLPAGLTGKRAQKPKPIAAPSPESNGSLFALMGADSIHPSRGNRWPLLLAAAWLATIAAGLGRFLFLRAKLRHALDDKQRITGGPLLARLHALAPRTSLWSSTKLTSPLVIDRHNICVPSYAIDQLDEASQAAMLAHEVEHLARRDGTWLLFAYGMQIAFPFQPLIRVAIRRLRQDAELLCDEAALAHTGDGLALARCLATVAERYTRPQLPTWSAAMAATPSELIQRVERALAGPAKPLPRGSIRLTAALGATALALLACTGPRVATKGSAALANAPDPSAELAIAIQVVEPGTRYRPGLNGAEPTIPWEPSDKEPWVLVGHRTQSLSAGVRFPDDDRGLESLAEFLKQLVPQNPDRKLLIQPEQGVVYSDIIPVLDTAIAAGFVNIDFAGTNSERVSTRVGAQAAIEDSVTRATNNVRAAAPGPAQNVLSASPARQLEALAGLGYLETPAPSPAQKLDSELPPPAFTITVGIKGTISIDGEPLVAADSSDFGPLKAALIERVQTMQRTPFDEAGTLLVVDEPVRISMSMETPFRRVLAVYQRFGQRDIAIENAQLEFNPKASGQQLVLAVPLPREVPPQTEEGIEPALSIDLQISPAAIKLVTPDSKITEMSDQSLRSDKRAQLVAALTAATKRWPDAPLAIAASGKLPASAIATVLTAARQSGLNSRIYFSAYMP